MLPNAKSLGKIEGLHNRALRFLHGRCTSSNEILLFKAGKVTMSVSRTKIVCDKKTTDNINPNYE